MGARLLAVVTLAAVPAFTAAHHSTAEYDNDVIAEAQGTVVGVVWRNPHVRLTISTEAFDGETELWELEGMGVMRLDRVGIPRDLIGVGTTVRFAGNPSTRRNRHMYVTNVLMPDGEEILLRTTSVPRWSDDILSINRPGDTPPVRATGTDGGAEPVSDAESVGGAGPVGGAELVGDARSVSRAEPVGDADAGRDTAVGVGTANDVERPRGLFRVWVPAGNRPPDWADDPPLTPEARRARDAYDPIVDDPLLDCTPPGMPRVISRSGGHPIRFVERGGDIVLQNEYFALERVIHMQPGFDASALEPTPLGHSVGRWEDDTLVVTTTRIDWPYFQLYGLEGVPQSPAMQIVERFTVDATEDTLRYDIAATDPAVFTRPVVAENYVTFRWQPGLDFLPYECVLTP